MQLLKGIKVENVIIEKAMEIGASLAGITSIAALKASPSYAVYDKRPYYDGYKGVEWKEEYKSVLVLALAHPESKPVLDWWSMKVPGFTPGNRALRDLSKNLKTWLGNELGIKAHALPYQIEFGGAFLKDAAVLAGLGVFGKNNLLVTPEFGSLVRLRGIFLEPELIPTGPAGFDPCKDCVMHCRKACPEDAFRSGTYERDLCKIEQDRLEAAFEIMDGSIMGIEEASDVIRYCRKCEIACPVGRAAAP
ncbi:MAG: epoxyqueuosine reductase [Spirochaetales bacterium]|nr:MAG: epoxyqueuosine reductase [Spirochaetales bacterium]